MAYAQLDALVGNHIWFDPFYAPHGGLFLDSEGPSDMTLWARSLRSGPVVGEELRINYRIDFTGEGLVEAIESGDVEVVTIDSVSEQ